MIDVMIDLETMSTRSNAAIVSIGAVIFDETSILDEFYTPVNLTTCIEHGLHVDPRTVEWWEKQDPDAVLAWKTDSAPNMISALTEFCAWIRKHGDSKIVRPWGNGADFDLVIMINAFNSIDADPPWQFYNHRCFRTLKNMFPVQRAKPKDTKHHALNDARNQALHLIDIIGEYDLRLG